MIDNFIDIFPSFNLVKGGDKNRFFSYCQQFNNLQNQLRVIHVVGTNGKGSVSNYLATMLKNNGYHTGLFISPSYQYHNERIQCNNIAITDQQLLHYLNTIHQKISFQPINFFELFFLVALHYFVDQKCEICVLEAGIGGQFDPTSVCTNTWFNVLTSVSYDHQDLLGTTIPQIINQKMLVAPNNQKFFIAPSNYQYHQIINSYPNPKIWVNLQKFSHNYFLNEAASIVTTIANHHQLTPNVNWLAEKLPARMMFFAKNIIFDGAHNYDAIVKLTHELKNNYSHKQIAIIYSSLQQKAFEQSLSYLNANFSPWLFVTTFNHPQAIQPKLVDPKYHWINYDHIPLLIKNYPNYLWVFCGSFYFLSQVSRLLTR